MSTDFTGSQGFAQTSSFDPEFLRAGQRLSGVFTLKEVLPTSSGELPIWIAEDEVAGQEVSLHFLPADVGTDPDVCEAVRAEVKKVRQLIHPNILRVHDLSDEPDWSAVVMDPFHGQSLAKLLEENPKGFFEAEEVLPWVDSILQTLSDVHGIGVFHKNLSLHDIILTSDERILISGFGISRVIADAMHQRKAGDESQFVYTSPQLIGGGFSTPSDDIYSFGACLFELLTGRPIFQGSGIEQKIRSDRPPAVMEARVRLGRIGDLLYPNWEKVISLCLSKDRSERPDSVAALRQRLGFGSAAGFEKSQPAPEPAPTVSRPVSAPAATAAAPAAKAPEAAPISSKPEQPAADVVHMGVAGEDDEPVDLDSDARETINFGERRPLLSSPPTAMEQERRDRNTRLARLLLLVGTGLLVWFGGRAAVRHFYAKPVVIKPVENVEPQPAPEPDKSAEPRFVAPAAPGTPPELTALRPGQPIKPKTEPGSVPAEGISAVPLDPPASQQPKPKPLLQPVPPPQVPPPTDADPKLEEAQKALEAALAESLTAAKEYEKLKGRKNPTQAQKNAIQAAKKAKEKAEQKVVEAQKVVDELTKAAQPAVVAPVPVGDPRKPANGVENTVGMLFVPVGDVLFSMFETRVKDYAQFVEETGYQRSGWHNPGFDQGPDHPVVFVTWNDANSFCKWLTDRERKLGALTGNDYYRLPTDLEWSKAVGLPDEGGKSPMERDKLFSERFPWGLQWPPTPGSGNFNGTETGSDIAIRSYTDEFPWTAPVGSFKPNEYGLYDMSGNVWEWCMDTIEANRKERVLRGGSWRGSVKQVLGSSVRISTKPDKTGEDYGFRVVIARDGGRFQR